MFIPLFLKKMSFCSLNKDEINMSQLAIKALKFAEDAFTCVMGFSVVNPCHVQLFGGQ